MAIKLCAQIHVVHWQLVLLNSWSVFINIAVRVKELYNKYNLLKFKMASLENMFAVFQEGTSNETTICHPNMYTLRKHFNYSLVCNLTYENSGMSWFCGKPVNKNLLCDDWHLTYASNGLPLTASDVELELLTKYVYRHLCFLWRYLNIRLKWRYKHAFNLQD